MALTLLERLLVWILRTIAWMLSVFLTLPASLRKSDGSARLPPITNPLLTVTAMQLARMIRRKEVGNASTLN